MKKKPSNKSLSKNKVCNDEDNLMCGHLTKILGTI